MEYMSKNRPWLYFTTCSLMGGMPNCSHSDLEAFVKILSVVFIV